MSNHIVSLHVGDKAVGFENRFVVKSLSELKDVAVSSQIVAVVDDAKVFDDGKRSNEKFSFVLKKQEPEKKAAGGGAAAAAEEPSVQGNLVLNRELKTMTFTPTLPLEYDTAYEGTMRGGQVEGYAITTYSFAFTTSKKATPSISLVVTRPATRNTKILSAFSGSFAALRDAVEANFPRAGCALVSLSVLLSSSILSPIDSDASIVDLRENDVLMAVFEGDAPLDIGGGGGSGGGGGGGGKIEVAAVPVMETIARVDLTLGPQLAKGAFSTVYRGTWRSSPVAIKVLSVQGERMEKALKAELAVLASLHHPRVLMLMAICNNMQASASEGGGAAAAAGAASEMGLVVELMERGSLYSVLHETLPPPPLAAGGGAAGGEVAAAVSLSLTEMLRIAVDISDGMRFLHASRLIHRDLKSGNVLVQADGRAKVSDFGLSGFRDASTSHMTGITGTPAWTAPEALREEQVHASCDVYSFGVIMWEFMTRQVPWAGVSTFQIIHRVAGDANQTLVIPPASAACPETIREIIRRCFLTAAERPTFDELFVELSALLLSQVRQENEALRRVPDCFICPISMEVMVDPVLVSDSKIF